MEIDSSKVYNNTSPTLRPMDFGELLDTTFSLYRRNFLGYLGIATIYFITMIIGGSISLFNESVPQIEWVLIWTLTLIVICCIFVVVVSGFVLATAQAYIDNSVKSVTVLKYTINRFFPCFIGLLFYGLLTVLAAFLLTLFLETVFDIIRMNYSWNIVLSLLIFLISASIAVYFITSWCFFAAAILVERQSIRLSFSRRRELMRGMTLQHILGTMTAIFLLFLSVTFIFRFSLTFLLTLTGFFDSGGLNKMFRSIVFIQIPIFQGELSPPNIVLYLINIGVDSLTMPIWVIGSTLLYFDQRIRNEAFDIEMMAERQGE